MDANCKNYTEPLWIFWILVKSNASMFYRSIQTVSQAEIKGSVYSKINITRRKIDYIIGSKLFKWITRSLEKIFYQV